MYALDRKMFKIYLLNAADASMEDILTTCLNGMRKAITYALKMIARAIVFDCTSENHGYFDIF